MHTAQNYKQKGEANIIYFQVETLAWWIIADLRNQHIELLDRALLTGAFICVETKAELFVPSYRWEEGVRKWKKDNEQKLKTKT